MMEILPRVDVDDGEYVNRKPSHAHALELSPVEEPTISSRQPRVRYVPSELVVRPVTPPATLRRAVSATVVGW